MVDQKGMDVINFPYQSPDLNLIENIWSVLKRRIKKRFSVRTPQELFGRLTRIWYNLEERIMERLNESM